ncbi:MAG: DnaJ-like cysteine-rich domain-containing protein [Planctomycetota bacterium]
MAWTPSVLLAEKGELTEAGRRWRIARLKSRATEWLSARRKLVGTCPRCTGRGFVYETVFQGGKSHRVRATCPRCRGRQQVASSKRYRQLFYEMRTPAYRLQPGVKEQLEREYRKADEGNPWPERLVAFMIRKVELADDTHGIVWFTADKDKTWRPMYWIWAKERNRSPKWFVHDEVADGAWPVAKTKEPVSPLSTEDRARLAETIKSLKLAFDPVELHLEGKTLVIHLRPVEPKAKVEERIGTDAVRLARAVLGLPGEWSGLRSEWHLQWRNKLGHVEWRPAWSGYMARDKLAKIAWENLSPKERVELLEWQRFEHEGWILWPRHVKGGE